jgi:hypothetical protein
VPEPTLYSFSAVSSALLHSGFGPASFFRFISDFSPAWPRAVCFFRTVTSWINVTSTRRPHACSGYGEQTKVEPLMMIAKVKSELLPERKFPDTD